MVNHKCKISARTAIVVPFHFRMSVNGHCRNCLDTLLSNSLLACCQKPKICRCIFDSICHHSKDIRISGFGDHIAISGYRSLSQSTGDTFFELIVIENSKIGVRSSRGSWDKSVSVFDCHILFPVSIWVSVAGASSSVTSSKTSAVGISMLSVIFPKTDIYISGFYGHNFFALSGCWSLSK